MGRAGRGVQRVAGADVGAVGNEELDGGERFGESGPFERASGQGRGNEMLVCAEEIAGGSGGEVRVGAVGEEEGEQFRIILAKGAAVRGLKHFLSSW